MADDLFLDTDGDLTVDDAQELKTVTGASEVAQAGGICLRAHKREYKLDQNFGPDWVNEVLTKPYRKASAERHITAELLTVRELTGVLDIDLAPSADTPTALSGSVEIETIYGPESITI